MIHCLSYDVDNININMNFLNNLEVIEHYRQFVMNSENTIFFGCVIEKFQRLKIKTMGKIYEKNQI